MGSCYFIYKQKFYGKLLIYKQTVLGKLSLKQPIIGAQIKKFPVCMHTEDEIYVWCHHFILKQNTPVHKFSIHFNNILLMTSKDSKEV
jgi:hypothetical protein